jgi:hypothetical protein
MYFKLTSILEAIPSCKINMDIQKMGREEWIDLAQNREGWRALANAAMDLRVP